MSKTKNGDSPRKLWWWGYKHINGTYQVKRDFLDGGKAIEEAKSSDFIWAVTEPFKAIDRKNASRIIKEKLG